MYGLTLNSLSVSIINMSKKVNNSSSISVWIYILKVLHWISTMKTWKHVHSNATCCSIRHWICTCTPLKERKNRARAYMRNRLFRPANNCVLLKKNKYKYIKKQWTLLSKQCCKMSVYSILFFSVLLKELYLNAWSSTDIMFFPYTLVA